MMQFVIPIDKAIREFLLHLDVNPRTIFSSKFGDGKSYFFDEFTRVSSSMFQY